MCDCVGPQNKKTFWARGGLDGCPRVFLRIPAPRTIRVKIGVFFFFLLWLLCLQQEKSIFFSSSFALCVVCGLWVCVLAVCFGIDACLPYVCGDFLFGFLLLSVGYLGSSRCCDCWMGWTIDLSDEWREDLSLKWGSNGRFQVDCPQESRKNHKFQLKKAVLGPSIILVSQIWVFSLQRTFASTELVEFSFWRAKSIVTVKIRIPRGSLYPLTRETSFQE